MNYYYLAASLPVLKRDSLPPWSLEEFMRQCRPLLTEADRADLGHVIQRCPHPVVASSAQAWQAIEAQIRQTLAAFRAAKYRVQAPGPPPSYPGFSESARCRVEQAMEEENPKEREWLLDQTRWDLAEELAEANPFGFGRILGFAVQLQILERWSAIQDDTGRRRVDQFLCDRDQEPEMDPVLERAAEPP